MRETLILLKTLLNYLENNNKGRCICDVLDRMYLEEFISFSEMNLLYNYLLLNEERAKREQKAQYRELLKKLEKDFVLNHIDFFIDKRGVLEDKILVLFANIESHSEPRLTAILKENKTATPLRLMTALRVLGNLGIVFGKSVP